MKVMDVLSRIKRGEALMVTLPDQPGHKRKYSLTDGTDVSGGQFDSIKVFLLPADVGLFPDAEPQSYRWGG